MSHYIGVDLAWGEGSDRKAANETGLVMIDDEGTVLDAGWVRGIDAVLAWLTARATSSSLIAIDAPLVVSNATGMRDCEREVGRAYGRWQVSANATNLGRGWQAGISLRDRLEEAGLRYWSGLGARARSSATFFECYPYTTLVGASEFGYDDERPRYKRPVRTLTPSERREFRARECDELIRRFAGLRDADPPIDLASHTLTRSLLDEPSPLADIPYKHREDLLDAAIAAWTAALWDRFGTERCQVLGADSEPDSEGRVATIIAPARPEQRKSSQVSTKTNGGSARLPGATAPAIAGSLVAEADLSRVKQIEFLAHTGHAISVQVDGQLRIGLLEDGHTLRIETDRPN
ncbi:DUF429 domain-containing protein [Agromyces sp. M3QZ16-3]|uniref:DUF429 domain-containing protein n=1 Tax=Agromyces sp. M3QZ16-3 TaxID=3447585 RepID=UPI003F68CBA6